MHQSLKSQRNDLIRRAWLFAGLMVLFLVYLITHGIFAVHCWLADMPQKVSKWAFAEGRGEVDRLSFSSPWDPKASNNHIVAEVTVRQPLDGRLIILVEGTANANRFRFSGGDNNQNTCRLRAKSIPRLLQEKCKWAITVNSRFQVKDWGRRLFTPGWLEQVQVVLFYQESGSSNIERVKKWSVYTTFPYANILWKLSWVFVYIGFSLAIKNFCSIDDRGVLCYAGTVVKLIYDMVF